VSHRYSLSLTVRNRHVIYVQLLLFGACIGVVSGMLGIGGGIILVPGLMLLFGFTQQEAQGTSLAALIPPIGIFAALVYYQNGFVKIPVAGAVAVGFMVGALGGALLVPRVPIEWLRLAFGALLLYLGGAFVCVEFPAKSVSMAALPAGLAAIVTAIGAWLRGRQLPGRQKLPPPDGTTEYHI
jgi:uncharacterized membrane protein YfcA